MPHGPCPAVTYGVSARSRCGGDGRYRVKLGAQSVAATLKSVWEEVAGAPGTARGMEGQSP